MTENLFTEEELEKLDEMLTNLDVPDKCNYCDRELDQDAEIISSRLDEMTRFCCDVCCLAWEEIGESLGFPV